MTNYILDYYQQIQDGTACVGKWVRLWYEQIVKGLENRSYFYNAKKAAKAIKFIEAFCRHHEGELAPQHIRLELWQKAMLSVIFGIVDEEGVRQFREIVVVLGRKNGKTLLAAAISNYMTFLDGEYGGRIFFVAPKLDQARLCYDALYEMIRKEPELAELTKKRRTDIYVQSTNTTARPIAFNAKKSDGLNPSCVICDEVSSWQGDAGLKQYEVLKSALGARRQPFILNISTAGYVDEGIFDELIKRSTAVLNGDSRETRLAPFLYMIDDVEKWNSLTELQKSMPNLGVSVSYDYMLEEIAIAEGSLSKKTEFLTKYCNIKQNSSMAWLEAQTIQKASGPHLNLEDFRRNYAVMGVDLSRTIDLSSVVTIIEKDGKLYTFAQFFLPAEKIDEATARDGLPYRAFIQRGLLTPSGDNFIDYQDVFKYITMLIEKYQILPLRIGYDRYSAQYLIQDLKNYGAVCDDVYQGENLSPVIDEMEGMMKDGTVCIGDNDLLKIHLLNSATRRNAESNRRKLVKVNPSLHIDGAAAMLDALTVRQKWAPEIGEQLKNRRKTGGAQDGSV